MVHKNSYLGKYGDINHYSIVNLWRSPDVLNILGVFFVIFWQTALELRRDEIIKLVIQGGESALV
ncbi:MAG: hypothetical protein HC916_00875 [Coleofasciculaceae cyanobacterium SM2_1_6]|nr:hypothetical protein [Coleofasciculaceae cyanobacterium SM2_1_6]